MRESLTATVPRHEPFVVLDFETSGVSPQRGDRAIEVGAVRVERGRVVARFQSLMNPGFRINRFIEDYTGISNEMLEGAPDNEVVMEQFRGFIADDVPIVAHNAAFDKRFLECELKNISCTLINRFGCSMLAARRIYPNAPNHKLGTLVAFKQIEHAGTFHRALADAEMTARLWLKMLIDLQHTFGFNEIPFQWMCDLTRVNRNRVNEYFSGKLSASMA